MITLSLSLSSCICAIGIGIQNWTGIRPSVAPFSFNNHTEIRTNDRRVKVTGISFEECGEQRKLS